jgi:hypothetical protein
MSLPGSQYNCQRPARDTDLGPSAVIRYRAKVESSHGNAAIAELLRQTDAVAEIHNTVRKGVPAQLLLD